MEDWFFHLYYRQLPELPLHYVGLENKQLLPNRNVLNSHSIQIAEYWNQSSLEEFLHH